MYVTTCSLLALNIHKKDFNIQNKYMLHVQTRGDGTCSDTMEEEEESSNDMHTL